MILALTPSSGCYGSSRSLGCGFLEPVYQEALAIEFSTRQIPFKKEIKFPVFYKDVRLQAGYRPDFICFDGVVVELRP